MRNIFLTILFVLSLISCEKSNEEKAKEAIHTYLNENLDDMSSYEPVKFGTLDTVYKLDLSGTSFANSDVKSLVDEFQMFHSYRIKDGINKHLVRRYFKINQKFEVIDISNYTYVNRVNNVIIAEPDTVAADDSYYPN
jgi:hypothetical protein